MDLDFSGPSTHLILGISGVYPKEEKGIVPPEVFGMKYLSIIYYAGDSPFVGTVGDFTAPGNMNDAYWAYADTFISGANDRNILVILAPLYIGYNNAEGWMDKSASNSQATLTGYATWFCTRYAGYPNVMYVWGNDISTGDFASREAKIRAMAQACSTADPDALHLFHGRRSTTYSDYWRVSGEAWLDVRGVYGGLDGYSQSQSEYQASPTLPTFNFELFYENRPGSPDGTPLEMRQEHWLATLNGSLAGNLYGNECIWIFGVDNGFCAPFTDWRNALNDAGRLDMIHIKNLLETFEWWKLVPSYGTALLTSSRGGGTSNYVTLAKTSDNKTIIAYATPSKALTIITNQLASGAGPIGHHDWQWYDPSTGLKIGTGGTNAVNSAATVFSDPGSQTDAVLIITDHPTGVDANVY